MVVTTIPELEAGMYSVSLIVDGVIKASIGNVTTKAGETQTLNFEIVKGSRATPFAPGKHYVLDSINDRESSRNLG